MVVPTYKMVSATVFGKDLENVQEVDGTSFEVGGPWAKKREAIYFRGRPSSDVRYELVEVFFSFSLFFCTGMDIEVTGWMRLITSMPGGFPCVQLRQFRSFALSNCIYTYIYIYIFTLSIYLALSGAYQSTLLFHIFTLDTSAEFRCLRHTALTLPHTHPLTPHCTAPSRRHTAPSKDCRFCRCQAKP